MRKNIFLSVILSLCVANFGAFAANQRGNARATNNANATQQQSSGAPVAARAAARNTVKNSGVSTAKPAATSAAAPVSARAANRQQVVSNNAGKKTAAAPAAAPKANGARAAATQKVINNGTKVATATTNTVVSQECQDAFFGCMDSFCMLDNASGGRCTCSDRNEDLKKVMDDIALLDEQSYAMATEGVERIKMGENADDIIARAKSAGDKAAGKAEKTDDKTKVRSLDLNAWNSGIFSEDDDIFDGLDMSVDSSAVSSALSKSGDALYVSSAKMCLGQMPTQCSGSVQMLQNIYAQKIKSDCMAFENSLKQQKIASTQKLQTAEKALRDAALEQFQSENKMDLGECTIAFKECMKTTAGCGEDWTGCVGITAAENAKNNNSKQTSIKGKYANITLGAASLQTLTNKKALCESVTKQCVNESDRVWETFLAEVAPEIKTAELLAEDKLRTNCLTDVADCFKDACGAKFDPEQDGNDFDLCLSDPSMVAGLCKVKLDPCLKAFNTSDTAETIMRNKGATDNILWKGVKARLKVMQVNACTKELKECLTAEEACGSDYSGCLGLTTDDIVKLCPEEKLLACQDEYNLETVRKNLMEFAQTIALNIDNNMLEICQNSVKKAMESTCGDEKMCPNISFAEGNIKDLMSMRICKDKNLSSDATGGTTVGDNLICYPDVYAVNKTDDIIKGFVQATLVGKPDMSFIDVDYSKETVLQRAMVVNGKRKMSKPETEIQYFSVPDDKQNIEEIKTVVRMLEQAVDTKMNQLSKDPKVEFCVTGRQIQGISEDADNSTKVSANQTGRYPNLLDSVREEISSEALANLMSVVETVSAEVIEQDYEKVNNTINDRLTTLIAMDQQKQHQYNEAACKKKEERHGAPNIHGCRREYSDTIATYDSSTSVCSIVTTTYRRNGCGMSYKFYEQSKSTITASMPVVTRETMVKGGASETAVEAEQTTLGNYN